MWQDWAILVVQGLFALALVPAVVGPRKPEPMTCAMTASLLYFLAFVFWTLALWASVGSTILVAGMWTVLLFQQWRGR